MSVLTARTEVFSGYVGGQLEVQNPGEGYLYRGEISSVEVVGDGQDCEVTVNFNWLAKFSDGRWVKTDPTEWQASTPIYSLSEIGQGRLCMTSQITGELAVFFPVGGSQLQREKVFGLS